MPADSRSPRGDDISIYLDHAAATPLRPDVEAAMREAAEQAFANPSSPHAAGRRARAALESARERILAAIGGRSTGAVRDRLVFTSGSTEANRLGVIGTAGGRPGAIASSPRDHSSVTRAAETLAQRGWRAATLALDGRGSVAAAAERFLADTTDLAGPAILCITPVCGQTGLRDAIPVRGSRAERLRVHVDATQAVAWDAVSFRDLNATSLALSPHKFGGPRGIGAVVIRGDIEVEPLVPGPQELGLRGGTEAGALAAGFARALELAVAERQQVADRVTRLRDRFEAGAVAAAREAGIDSHVVGAGGDRAPHVSTIALLGLDRQAVVMAADLEGVCLATGTACASGSSDPSPAVSALGLPGTVARGAVRASFGRDTTEADVDEALVRLQRVFRGLAACGLLKEHRPG